MKISTKHNLTGAILAAIGGIVYMGAVLELNGGDRESAIIAKNFREHLKLHPAAAGSLPIAPN